MQDKPLVVDLNLFVKLPVDTVQEKVADKLEEMKKRRIEEYAHNVGWPFEETQAEFPKSNLGLLLTGDERLVDYLTLWTVMATGILVHFRIPEYTQVDQGLVRIPTIDFVRLCEYVKTKYRGDFESFCKERTAGRLIALTFINDLDALDGMGPDEAGALFQFLGTKTPIPFHVFYRLNGGLEEMAWRWLSRAGHFKRIGKSRSRTKS